MSRFGVVEPEDLPEDLAERVGAIAERSGFVPNIFRALGRRPAELRAFLDYHDALMGSDEGLSKAERELVVVATSGANHCTYCVVAHGAILRVYAKDPLVADQVAVNYRKANLSERQKAMLAFALKVATASAAIVEDDHAALREHGLGLAMCRRVVQEHGGEIVVESAPGGGALFRFSLPRARA